MLPNDVRERLAAEFRFAVGKMVETEDVPVKMYFYSVFFGEAQRMLNMAWDSNLALVHLVTQDVYRQISARINQVTAGQDRIVGLFPPTFRSYAAYAFYTFSQGCNRDSF